MRIPKTWSAICLTSVLIITGISLTTIGCSSRKPVATEEATKEKPATPSKLTLIAGSVGGGWWAIMEGFSEVIRKSLPGVQVTLTPGGDAQNVVAVSNGEADIGIAEAVTAHAGKKGVQVFEGKGKYENLAALTGIYTSAFHLVVTEGTGLKSLDDVVKRRFPLKIGTMKRDFSSAFMGRAIMAKYGITEEELTKWGGAMYWTSLKETIDMIRNGQANAVSFVLAPPVSQVMDLAATHPVRLLSVKDEVRAAINKEFGSFDVTIPGSTYPFEPNDIETVGYRVVLFVRKDFPEDLAYNVVRAIYDNRSYLGQVHVDLKKLTIDSMVDTGGVPLHPGAERFYKESGATQKK